jgi:twinkle protein
MPNLLKDVDYAKYLGTKEAQNLRTGSSFDAQLLSLVRGEEQISGMCLPWEKTYDKIRLRPGEVTLWAGISGHGKSHLVGQVMAELLSETRCLIASMEIKPQRTLYYILRQIAACSNPSQDFARFFSRWTNGRLWIYDQTDTVEADRILGMCWYAAEELGVNHIVIDSLMKCGISDEDYAGQKAFVDRLCWAAKHLDIHIHLVAHIRKTEDEFKIPQKWDVLGSSSITNLVDNVIIVHRNKKKEQKVEHGLEYNENEHDTVLSVVKQRHGEWEGNIFLWFDRVSQSFTGTLRGNWNHPIRGEFLADRQKKGHGTVLELPRRSDY